MVNWNNEKGRFPQMPDDMRKMVENEVEKQIKMESADTETGRRRVRMSLRRAAILAAAATLTLGTTVFAGIQMYQIYSEKEGNYGLKTFLGTGNSQDKLDVPSEIPVVDLKKNYIPEGMVQPEQDPNHIAWSDNLSEGGFSMTTVVMDQKVSAENFLLDTDVIYSENLRIADHDAVYLEIKSEENDRISFDKRFYIAYPEVWQVLQVYVGENVTKEEAMKVVENIELIPTGETIEVKDAYTWSSCVGETHISGDEIWKRKTEGIGKQTVSREEMSDMYTIGQSFVYNTEAGAIEAKVTDVQIGDNLSMLSKPEYIDKEWKEQADADGNLLPNKMCYLKAGNGVDTIDEVIRTEEIAQKLVDVTVEYTNTGEKELKDITFMGIFVNMTVQDNGYKIYNRSQMDSDEQTNSYYGTKAGGAGEMQYYDLHNETENKNHIDSLKPGETVVVHMARIINEDELPYLYLNLSSSGGTGLEFTDNMLKQGFVDIRQ